MTFLARSKWVIAKYGVVIAFVLAAIGVLAVGGAVSSYTSPTTEEVVETVDEQTFTTGTDTSAVVVGDSSLYDRGETLRNKPVYFYNVSSNATLHVRTAVPDDRAVDVSHRLVLRHVAARSNEPFWESRRVLGTTDGTATDGNASMSVTIDMRRVRRTVAEKRAEIGNIGTFQTQLRLVVEYRTESADGTLTASAPVVLTSRAYWFEGSLEASRTHTETRTRTVQKPPDAIGALLLGGFGSGVLLLAVGIAALSRREFDLNRIEMEITRSRYDEWISRGEIPTKAEKQYIPIDTLEDLVDIAIDSNKRVIYDTSYDTYGVVDVDLVYYYAAGDEGFGEWLEI